MKKILNNYKAFLFDLNGTMINDMPYHVQAWQRVLNDLGAKLSLEKVKEECYGKNTELLERIFPGRFSQEEKERIGLDKEKQYQKEFLPDLKLTNDLPVFLKEAHEKDIKLAIGSAAILFNIDFVLDGLQIRKYFEAWVSSDDVHNSKPDPETWLKCAEKLKMKPGDCLVFEDSLKGVESAMNAGMKTIVITNMHTKEEFYQYPNVTGFIKDYEEISISKILKLAP